MSSIDFGRGIMLEHGDSRDVLRRLPDACIDSVVTDPPYALVSIVKRFGSPDAAPPRDGDVYTRASAGFMGKQWDTGETAFAVEFWAEVMRVLKPGGHVIAASGTRTYHRLAVAIEDAGFEIRDQILWLYGSGFPKSHDVSKGIDKALGAVRTERAGVKAGHENFVGRDNMKSLRESGVLSGEGGYSRPWMHDPEKVEAAHYNFAPATPEAAQWQGWGTALKPACEPWVLARKPLIGTVAVNVLAHGTGALNIDGCRIPTDDNLNGGAYSNGDKDLSKATSFATGVNAGTFVQPPGRWPANVIHDGSDEATAGFPDSGGSAARYFYCPKASKSDRGAYNSHPTVKPTELMRYLCRLVTPPGGVVLDPFMGSGSTGKACVREGFQFIGIERESEYFEIAAMRMLDETGRR